jgi:hypothetical protein
VTLQLALFSSLEVSEILQLALSSLFPVKHGGMSQLDSGLLLGVFVTLQYDSELSFKHGAMLLHDSN